MPNLLRGKEIFKGDLFHNPKFDEQRFLSDMEKNLPPRMFGIIFTPRSGSSWLTDVLTKTRHLGSPKEWFNPNFIPSITQSVNARDLDGYIDMIQRKHKAGGCFSYEITPYQMRRVFGGSQNFLNYFPANTPMFHLTREDIVLQAVSLAKAVKTSVFHSVTSSSSDVVEADKKFSYDADFIEQWLEHIFDQEKLSEEFFAKSNIKIRRISYEGMMKDGADATARRFVKIMRPAKYKELEIPELVSSHQKIASSLNEEFAARFRKERPEVIAKIDAFRAACRAG